MSTERLRFLAGVAGMLIAMPVLLGLLYLAIELRWPLSMVKSVAAIWILATAIGAASLLAYFNGSARIPERYILAGLVIGNIAAIFAVVTLPVTVIVLSVPIVVGALVIGKLRGRLPALVYGVLPFIALVVRILVVYSGMQPIVWNQVASI